ncbi:MAG: type IX secretion system membrane protein PorP/SprF, partial [Saprospiraceae bacterium]
FGPSDSRVSFLGGVRVEQFRFYYSYDQSYQTFQNFNNGSHELTLSFDLGKGKQASKQKMNGESDTMGETKN